MLSFTFARQSTLNRIQARGAQVCRSTDHINFKLFQLHSPCPHSPELWVLNINKEIAHIKLYLTACYLLDQHARNTGCGLHVGTEDIREEVFFSLQQYETMDLRLTLKMLHFPKFRIFH